MRRASARESVVKVAPVSTMKRMGRPFTVPLVKNCPRASASTVTLPPTASESDPTSATSGSVLVMPLTVSTALARSALSSLTPSTVSPTSIVTGAPRSITTSAFWPGVTATTRTSVAMQSAGSRSTVATACDHRRRADVANFTMLGGYGAGGFWVKTKRRGSTMAALFRSDHLAGCRGRWRRRPQGSGPLHRRVVEHHHLVDERGPVVADHVDVDLLGELRAFGLGLDADQARTGVDLRA